MNVEELRRAADPFFEATTVYAKVEGRYHRIMCSTYMHDEEGHLVLVVDPDPVHAQTQEPKP